MMLALLALLSLPQIGPPSPPRPWPVAFDSPDAPRELQLPSSARGPVHEPWLSTLEWDPLRHEVSLHWSWPCDAVVAYRDFGWPGAPEQTQTYPTSYFPTASATIDDARVLVAGVDDAGRTILELWSFAWRAKNAVPLLAPSGGPAETEIEPARIATRVLWSADEPGRHWIEGLAPLSRAHRPTTHALARFHDSGALARLDLADGTLLPLARDFGPLGERPLSISVDERERGGFAYTFWIRLSNEERFGCGRILQMLEPILPVLIDEDGDGLLDRREDLSWAQWSAERLPALR